MNMNGGRGDASDSAVETCVTTCRGKTSGSNARKTVSENRPFHGVSFAEVKLPGFSAFFLTRDDVFRVPPGNPEKKIGELLRGHDDN